MNSLTRWLGRRDASSPSHNFPTTSFTTGTPTTLTVSSSTLPPLPTPRTIRSHPAVPPQMAFDQHHHHDASEPSTHRGIQLSRTRPQSVPTMGTTATGHSETTKTNEFAIDSDDDDEFLDDVEFGDVIVANATRHVEQEAHLRRISTHWRIAGLLIVAVGLGFVVAVVWTVANVTLDTNAATQTAPPHAARGDALSQSSSAVLENLSISSVMNNNNNNNTRRMLSHWLE